MRSARRLAPILLVGLLGLVPNVDVGGSAAPGIDVGRGGAPAAEPESRAAPLTEAARPAASTARIKRPNILVIVTDDQREGLSVMPSVRKWFGRGGKRFTRAYATTPLCCPARASIMTGRYVHNHGVLTNPSKDALDHSTTVQRYLRQAGYRTAIAGKFLNRWEIGLRPPYFDRWALTDGAYYDYRANVDGNVFKPRRYSTDFIADRAVRFLNQLETNDARPWFLYVAPFAPHPPHTPEPAYVGAPVPPWSGNPAVFERDRSDKPPWVQEGAVYFGAGSRVRRAQLHTLMSVDDLVERIFRTLGGLGETRDTLALFLSDNGYLWGEHGLLGKRHPYLQSVRIPLLLRWPGRVAPGTTDGRLAANIDVAPTILAAAGAARSSAMDGRSLLGARRGRLLLEYWPDLGRVPAWAALVTPRSQYIEYYPQGVNSSVIFPEYYRLDSDPWQLNNLVLDVDAADEWGALRLQLVQDRSCAGATCP